jgi:hypothetical protein
MRDGQTGACLAQFRVIVASGHQELECFLVSKNGGPGERSVPTRCWVWIPHVCSLNEALDNEEVVLLDCAAEARGSILLRH